MPSAVGAWRGGSTVASRERTEGEGKREETRGHCLKPLIFDGRDACRQKIRHYFLCLEFGRRKVRWPQMVCSAVLLCMLLVAQVSRCMTRN